MLHKLAKMTEFLANLNVSAPGFTAPVSMLEFGGRTAAAFPGI